MHPNYSNYWLIYINMHHCYHRLFQTAIPSNLFEYSFLYCPIWGTLISLSYFFFSNSLYPQLTRSILIIINQNLLDINATNIHHHYHKIFSKLIWFLIFHMAGMMHTRVNIIFANNFPNSVNDHSFFSNSFFFKFWDQIVNSKDYIH